MNMNKILVILYFLEKQKIEDLILYEKNEIKKCLFLIEKLCERNMTKFYEHDYQNDDEYILE